MLKDLRRCSSNASALDNMVLTFYLFILSRFLAMVGLHWGTCASLVVVWGLLLVGVSLAEPGSGAPKLQ